MASGLDLEDHLEHLRPVLDGCSMEPSTSVLARPTMGVTVPHCFAMYLTAPLTNHMRTSLLPSQFVFSLAYT